MPKWHADFFTGIPAPAGAGLAFVPIYLWLVTGNVWFREWFVVMPWALGVAMLMISLPLFQVVLINLFSNIMCSNNPLNKLQFNSNLFKVKP